jgi:hypothetical protein
MAYKVGTTIVIDDSGFVDWSRIANKPAIGTGDVTGVTVVNGTPTVQRPTTATLKAFRAVAPQGRSRSRPTARPSTATAPAGADNGGSKHHPGALADAGHLL